MQVVNVKWIYCLLGLYILTINLTLKAESKLIYTKKIQTSRGVLTVQPFYKGSRVAWNDYRRFRKGDEFRLMLKNSLVTKFSVDRWAGINFRAVYTNKNNASFVLIALWPGGNACNGYFRVLEIPTAGKPILSEEFGTCFGVAISKHYKLNKNPNYQNGSWKIALESGDDKFLDWWIYTDGHIKQIGGADPDIAKWPKEQQSYMLQLKMRLLREEYEALLEQYGNPQAAYYGWLKGKINKVAPGYLGSE